MLPELYFIKTFYQQVQLIQFGWIFLYLFCIPLFVNTTTSITFIICKRKYLISGSRIDSNQSFVICKCIYDLRVLKTSLNWSGGFPFYCSFYSNIYMTGTQFDYIHNKISQIWFYWNIIIFWISYSDSASHKPRPRCHTLR